MAYHGRRAPNVTQYVRDIENLNEIPSEQELQGLDFDLEQDLALFTNTQFFDFDMGAEPSLPAVDEYDVNTLGESLTSGNLDMKPLDFAQGDFSFSDFTNFAQPSQSFVRDNRELVPPIDTQTLYPASSSSSPPSARGLPTPTTGEKRKAISPAAENYEEASRIAAEEDKRRRNTAASARFRVKKKQREAALEKSAKEMADKVATFEARIAHLEMENKWLKNLITERNESKEDISVLYNNYVQNESRKNAERKDGVGTKA